MSVRCAVDVGIALLGIVALFVFGCATTPRKVVVVPPVPSLPVQCICECVVGSTPREAAPHRASLQPVLFTAGMEAPQ